MAIDFEEFRLEKLSGICLVLHPYVLARAKEIGPIGGVNCNVSSGGGVDEEIRAVAPA